MFGGLAFLVGGHLAVAANSRGAAMVRCDPADTDSHVAEPGITRMVMRGRELDGWLEAAPAALVDDDTLRRWVRHDVRRVPAAPVTGDQTGHPPKGSAPN